MKKYLVILFVSIAIGSLCSQPQIEWYRTYNSPSNGNDRAASMAIDSLGNIIVCGSDGEGGYRTIKYTNTGQLLWSVRYFEFPGFPLVAKKVAVDALNNIYVTGYNESIVTVKYNALGILQWVRKYKGNGSFLSEPHDMEIDRNGFIYVTGESSVQGTFFDYVTIKYNQNGDSLWTRTYNGIGNGIDRARAIEIDSLGNVYVTGDSESLHDTSYFSDITTLKYNPLGNVLWINRYYQTSNHNGVPYDMSFDNIDNIYVTGILEDSNYNQKIFTIKYNHSGIVLWNKADTLGESRKINIRNDQIYIGAITNIYITGADYTILKYDTSGRIIWRKIINGNIDDILEDIVLDDSSNCYFTGGFYNGKINIDGDLLWLQASVVNATTFMGKSLLLDRFHNLYVFGGFFPSGPSQTDFITVKYNQLIGTINISGNLPTIYKLHDNYPNPFNPVTNIQFDIPTRSNVSIIIYDILGKVVEEIVKQDFNSGSYRVTFDGSKYSSGIYFYTLQTENYSETKKMNLVK